MKRFVYSLILVLLPVCVQAEMLPLDTIAWRATDLLDAGRWEDAAAQAETAWQRCKQLPDVDLELRLLVLRTLSESLTELGRTEEALAYTQLLLQTAQEGGTNYSQEQIFALVDLSRLYGLLADLPQAYKYAKQAMDAGVAYVATNMPEWVVKGNIEAITDACGLAEDVYFAGLDVLEDAYLAADESARTQLRNSLKPEAQAAELRTMYEAVHSMVAASSGKRRVAMEAVEQLYRHTLCHTLLIAQRMQPQDSASIIAGEVFVREVLRVALPDEAAYTRATARMAACYTLAGQYDSTLVWLKRLEKADTDKAYSASITENRAWIAATKGNWQQALPLLKRGLDDRRKELVRDFYYQTAEARQHIWLSKYLWYFRQNIALCAGEDTPGDVQAFVYDNLLASKGILLSAETEVLTMLRAHDPTHALCDSMYALRRAHRNGDDAAHIEQLEQLLSASHDLKALTRTLTLTWRDVQKALQPGEIAVEFFKTEDADAVAQMYALLLRREWKAPKIVYVGTCESFIPLQQQRTKILDPRNTERVWSAILTKGGVTEGERIYFSPDGSFYLTGIEYMLLDSAHTMFDKYDMHRMSSTRELCLGTRTKISASTSPVVLFGGVCYTSPGENSSVKYLPATLAEVQAIDSIVPQAVVYTCSQASEDTFKSLSAHSPQIIHVATHGFHLAAPAAANVQSARDMLLSRLTQEGSLNIEDYALSRSGLLLAGAGSAWGAESFRPKDDGVLTAREIAAIDLANTDIVVLSACQTGLGDITVDGVAGLQRGFKKAGCRSMLMSLWPVDDKATMLLMTEFYRQLSAGATPTHALEQAQLYLRTFKPSDFKPAAPNASSKPAAISRILRRNYNGKDAGYPYSSPYYWAAFVLLDAL